MTGAVTQTAGQRQDPLSRLVEELGSRLAGRYEGATIELIKDGAYGRGSALYVHFNDSLDNSLVVYPAGKSIEITNFQHLQSETIKSSVESTKTSTARDCDALLAKFEECYRTMLKRETEFRDELETSLDLDGVSVSEFRSIAGEFKLPGVPADSASGARRDLNPELDKKYQEFRKALEDRRYHHARRILDKGGKSLKDVPTVEEYRNLREGILFGKDVDLLKLDAADDREKLKMLKEAIADRDQKMVMECIMAGAPFDQLSPADSKALDSLGWGKRS